jgi:outer membrane lipoprotein-sorting protein
MDPKVLLALGDEATRELAGDRRMEVITELQVALPDRMRLSVLMKPEEMQMQVIQLFDGQRMWSSTRMKAPAGTPAATQPATQPATTATLRLDQKKLGSKDAPFDVGFNVRGHGLEEGTELLGTLRGFLEHYAMADPVKRERLGEEPCLVVSGQMSAEQGLKWLFDNPELLGVMVLARKHEAELEAQLGRKLKPRGGMLDMAANLLRQTRHLRLWISEEGGLPRKWTVGNGAQVAVEVVIEALEADVALPDSTFAVAEAQWKEAQDLTTEILKQRAEMAQALEDEAAAARVKAELRRLVTPTARRSRPRPPR